MFSHRIDNQRFYGSKQLSLSNNTNDATFMRDAVTSDTLAETDQLAWMPWDHNEALKEGRRSARTLTMDEIGDEWPLISFLLADEQYYDTYVDHVNETIHTVFQADEMMAKYAEIALLIEPYVFAKIGADAFAQGVQDLDDHTHAHIAEADAFLAHQAN